ncbi:MAG: YraN family protein [Alphaproteobacteria bacterium]|nr:YraN family protein [Alphaproteobacteria bacterium]
MTAARQRRERWGRRAETIAAAWLLLKGYRILARRVRTSRGEIDIIARKGRLLVFVEVKARRDLDDADAALHPAARRRVARASEPLFARYGSGCDGTRFDAVIVRPWRRPVHLVDAWRGDDHGW